MKRRTFLGSLAVCSVAGVEKSVAAGPVVLELFTSQGCSSCPPADALLRELSREPGVIALGWHVDYWDRSGWRDPFSGRAATERQRGYAERLDQQLYTPAMVVNGTRMVVGSDVARVREAIATTQRTLLGVSLRHDGDELLATIEPTQMAVTALLIAFDPERETTVGGGENGGRRLVEGNIVRAATPVTNWPRPPASLRLPVTDPRRGAALLVQDSAWRMVGAAIVPPRVTISA